MEIPVTVRNPDALPQPFGQISGDELLSSSDVVLTYLKYFSSYRWIDV
jgi:hypothetical protein